MREQLAHTSRGCGHLPSLVQHRPQHGTGILHQRQGALHLQGGAELCPNEKVVDESRFFDVHGCGGIDKTFQSHPVMWAHPGHVHRDPVLVNLSDFRQLDVYKGFLASQP